MALRDEPVPPTADGDIHALVGTLLRAVGPTVVQAMTGTKDRSMPARWARENGTTPRAVTEKRLRLGYQVWRIVEMAEGRDVALAFLLGANPRLANDLPVNAIYDLRAHEVLGAAMTFVEGVHGT